jgi:hypothetical protein
MSVWAFDVDGCIVDSLTGGSIRPRTVEILERLRAQGHVVVLWSAGGSTYAQGRARQHGFAHLISAAYGKQTRGADGRWSLSDFSDAHRPEVLVDDRPEEAPRAIRVIGVAPYIAPDEQDRGLESVLPLLSEVTCEEEFS